MWDTYFPQIILPMPIEEFYRLPRNAAYRYEYADGQAELSGRPKTGDVVLELRPRKPHRPSPFQEEITVRSLVEDDWEPLVDLFDGAFIDVQPFASLDPVTRETAVRACLTHTRAGNDGPLVADASLVATRVDSAEPCGAILVTLPKPRDEKQTATPRLNWIFAHRWHRRSGIGTTLLAHAVNRLLELDHQRLVSSFLIGNDQSILWHWQNAFELCSQKERFTRNFGP